MGRFSGVTLDVYDDRGETLRGRFPTPDALPDFIKQADLRPREDLPNEAFALLAADEGELIRKFACTDRGTTAMSVIYFMEHGDKLPEEAMKTAAANLVEACLENDLLPPPALTKVADVEKLAKLPSWLRNMSPEKILKTRSLARSTYPMRKVLTNDIGRRAAKDLNRSTTSWGRMRKIYRNSAAANIEDGKEVKKMLESSMLNKTSEIVDISGREPEPRVKVASAERDSDYAVITPTGERHYPLHSWDMIKTAHDYYLENKVRMEPEVRRQFAVKLAFRATSVGYPADGDILQDGARTMAHDGHLRAAVDMRKVAFDPKSTEREALDEIFEKRASLGPDRYAQALNVFDRHTGLDSMWDQHVLDPWASTFSLEKVAEVVWEDPSGSRVTRGELSNLSSNNADLLKKQFTPAIASEFVRDPVGVFESMPLPQKRIIARMAADTSADGGTESRDRVG